MNRRIHIDMQVQWPMSGLAKPDDAVQQGAVSAIKTDDARPDSLSENLKTYGSRELFEGSREVGIEHAGSLYRLKITRQGKLILNK